MIPGLLLSATVQSSCSRVHLAEEFLVCKRHHKFSMFTAAINHSHQKMKEVLNVWATLLANEGMKE